MKHIADCRILQSIVVIKTILQAVLTSVCCTFHQLIQICAGYCDGKKPYSSKYGETSSYIIRHYESLISFRI